MYLKSVELQGFKSFADKIYLDFNPGITAIVGPNGSGKSNISDAIRWVMGEQSVKSLRGSRMEDVIFAGTAVRKAQGFAEVSLTLDNSQRIFPIDFEEVTVTRRVYRSGEGEYFINKAACRLKDIHELFMDTGLGREGYSIVGQGKIDEILSNKSEDRRQIFEEAAGITKYKYRKNEAERKLERTNENLVRVRDIMSELEGQLEPLRIQSEKAKKYLNLRDALKVVDVNLSVATIDKLRTELAECEKSLDAVSESINQMQGDADSMEEKTRELYAKVSEYDEKTEAHREAQKQSADEVSEESRKISLLEAEIGHCRENTERIRGEMRKSENGLKQMDALLESYEQALKALEEESARIAEETVQAEAEHEKINALFEKSSESIENIKSEIIDKTSEINSLRGKIVNYNILIENFKTGRENSQKELDGKSGDFERLSENNAKLRTELDAVSSELDRLRADAEKSDTEYKRAAVAAKALEERQSALMSALNQKKSRCSVLRDMENDFEGYNRAVKSVMNAYRDGKLGKTAIYGPLSMLVSTEREYVTAIETALASTGQNIVTGNEQDAKGAIEYLRRGKLGRATFMPISTVRGRSADIEAAKGMRGFIAAADELVKYDSMYEGIVKNVLGATVVADNIDNAIAMAAKCRHRFRIVTLAGDVMQPGGAMSGGSSGKSSGVLSRAAEISALTDEISSLTAELDKASRDYAENRKALDTARAQIEEMRLVINDKNAEYIKLRADFEHSEHYLAEYRQSREQLLREISVTDERIRGINEDIEKCNSDIARLEDETDRLSKSAESCRSESEDILCRVRESQDLLLKLSIDKSANEKDAELQRERLSGVESERAELCRENSERAEQLSELGRRIEAAEQGIADGKKRRTELRERSKALDEELDGLSRLRRDAELNARGLQEKIREVREKLFTLGQQKAKLESKKGKTEQDLDGIFARLWDEYELTYTEAVKIRTEVNIDIQKASREISDLKSKIKALGNINIDAIGEYAEVSERFEFLTKQTNDLEKAKGELETVIDEIMGIMKKQFAEQFEIISRNFNSVFRELFGGGQANLSLADPSDLLESGIEIEAQPPGKKLQSLTLLSGGERAFTAIALLFAILKVRPTPFCILDEIEAALDDVNVYRYADYLKKYCSKTQFIVVTHRRGTMEAANILYGVTMQERGISKLLSLNIDDVTE